MDHKLLLEQLKMITDWLRIKGYPNYEVSICGMVRNVITKRILKPGINGIDGKNKVIETISSRIWERLGLFFTRLQAWVRFRRFLQ